MPPHDALVSELVSLVRGLRELGSSLPVVDGRRLDLPAAAVLGNVGDAGPLRLSDLAERLTLDLSTVSRQVASLEKAGWLLREPDPADRRAQLLRLTAAGERALLAKRRAHADVLGRVMTGWDDAELATLTGLLGRLNTDLTAHRTASPGPAPSVPAHLEAS